MSFKTNNNKLINSGKLKIKAASEYKQIKPSVVTIGTFDGVHIGHQKIIKRIVEIAKEKRFTSISAYVLPSS